MEHLNNKSHTLLSSPFTLKNGQVIKNRFMKSATSEQLGDTQHNPTKGLARVYQSWVKGEAGIIVTGNIMVDRNALGEPLNVVLDNNSDLSKFKKWAEVSTQHDTQCWVQLNHPGKQSPIFLSLTPVAPSAIPMKMGSLSSAFGKPRALSNEEVWEIIEKFATSAYLAKLVGFTGVQIHGAHGYLVNQFLSPSHNHRDDEWGGSEEKRMKFVIEIYKAIRKKVGDDFTVAIKLNSADFQKEGFSEDASMAVVKTLVDLGIDHVEISGGSYESQAMMGDEKALHKTTNKTNKNSNVKISTKKREAYFLNYAEKLREITDIPLTVTGGFRRSQAMQEALDDGATDFIGVARPILIYPDMPKKAMQDSNYVAEFDYPTTRVKIVDAAAMLSITWYEEQIHRVAKGKQPKADLSAWTTIAKMYGRMGKKAFSKRRA